MIKTIYLHAKSNLDLTVPEKYVKDLPKKLGIVTNIQHLHKIKDVLKQFPEAKIAGQVLGCNSYNAENIKKDVEGFLFVGSGVFHPIQVAMRTKMPVWCWSPAAKEFKKIDEKTIQLYEKRRKGAILSFLNAKNIGILVSAKIGQSNLKRALELKKLNDKNYFLFYCNTIDLSELENFNFIDCWVNTACPRIPDEMDETSKIVNIDELINEKIIQLPAVVKGNYEVPIWMSKIGMAKVEK